MGVKETGSVGLGRVGQGLLYTSVESQKVQETIPDFDSPVLKMCK